LSATFKDDPRGTVSEWVQSTLLRSKIPVAEVAANIRKSEDLIYKFANSGSENNIPAYALVILMAVCKYFTILKDLCEMFGYQMVPKPAWESICQGVRAMEAK
jgi:hypothetical protein